MATALSRLGASLKKRLSWRRDLHDAIVNLATLRLEASASIDRLLKIPHRFRGRGYFESLQLRQNTRELASLVSMLRGRSLLRICEIGTFRGGTLFLWCQLARSNGQIISVDLPGSLFGGGFRRRSLPFFSSFAQPGQRVDFVRGNSHDPGVRAKVNSLLQDGPLDFLFIDGDHTYAGVKHDYNHYAPLVRAGGVIAFHDILRLDSKPQLEVWRFWQELRAEQGNETLEFVDWGATDAMGIGVLVVREAPQGTNSDREQLPIDSRASRSG